MKTTLTLKILFLIMVSTRDRSFPMGSTRVFWKLALHMIKTFKTWGKSLEVPCGNEAKF